MQMAIKTTFARKYPAMQILGIILLPALGCLIACSSSDEAPGGGRLPPQPALSSSRQQQPSETYLSPLDKAIAQDRTSRPWSKNVPVRTCTKDDECGDGFCDRGRCAAIWTGYASHGQRCRNNDDCLVYLCLEGRCRSCVSDAECVDEPDNQDPECKASSSIPEARGCYGVAGSGQYDVVPSPFRSPKK